MKTVYSDVCELSNIVLERHVYTLQMHVFSALRTTNQIRNQNTSTSGSKMFSSRYIKTSPHQTETIRISDTRLN